METKIQLVVAVVVFLVWICGMSGEVVETFVHNQPKLSVAALIISQLMTVVLTITILAVAGKI